MRRAPNGPRCLARIVCAHEAPLIACAFNQIEKLLMRVDLELGVDVFNMGLHGIARNDEFLFDVFAVATMGEHLEHLALARREPMAIGKRGHAALERFRRGVGTGILDGGHRLYL